MAYLENAKDWKRLEKKLIREIVDADNDNNVVDLIRSVGVHLSDNAMAGISKTFKREARRRRHESKASA
jgi:hypothetical protein